MLKKKKDPKYKELIDDLEVMFESVETRASLDYTEHLRRIQDKHGDISLFSCFLQISNKKHH
jgi:hypothetical protein